MPVDAKTLIDWQTTMSNTAHQRQVADLQAAGLNPVLSAKLGGASTPSGAMDDISNGIAVSGSRFGSSSGTGVPSDGSIFGNLITNLNPNGTTRIGKISVPNWIIIGAYQKLFGEGGSVTPSDVAAAVGDQTGANVSGDQIVSAIYYDQNDNPKEDNFGLKSAWHNFLHFLKGEGYWKNGRYYYSPTSARSYGNGGR